MINNLKETLFFWCFAGLIDHLRSPTILQPFKVYDLNLKTASLGWWFLDILWWKNKQGILVTLESTSPLTQVFNASNAFTSLTPSPKDPSSGMDFTALELTTSMIAKVDTDIFPCVIFFDVRSARMGNSEREMHLLK